MGSILSVNLTPYVKILNIKTVEVVKSKRICLNHPSARLSREDKFCHLCGDVILDQEYREYVNVDPDDVFEKFSLDHDHLISIDSIHGVLIPNHNSPERFDIFDHSEDNDVNLLNSHDLMLEHISWFKDRYKQYIDALIEVYGEENVELCWGSVNYYI